MQCVVFIPVCKFLPDQVQGFDLQLAAANKHTVYMVVNKCTRVHVYTSQQWLTLLSVVITSNLMHEYTSFVSANHESLTIRNVTVKSVTDLMPPLCAITGFTSHMKHACLI